MGNLTAGGFYTSSIYRFMRNGQQLIALATSVFKVFVSYDEGLHWFTYPGALPDNIISSGLVQNDHIYLGTYHRGVWVNTLDDFSLQKVSGKAYWDENNNGIPDAGEKAAAGVLLSFDYYNQQTVTDSAGNYAFYTHFDGNADVLRPNLEHLPNVVSAPASYNVQAGTSGLNFALQNNSSIQDLEIRCILAGPLRPGKRSYYDVHVRNLGPASQNAVVEFIRSPVLIQAETYPPATTISGDTIRWNLNSLAPLETQVLRVMVKTPLGTPIGVQVTSVARVSPTDSNPDNNICTAVDTVTDALLSNVKLETHLGTISRDEVNAGEPLIYTILFQNVWPQTVHKLIVTDQLPALLDPTTVQLLETSHPCNWSIRSNGDLEFMFDMMNLPDSALDPAASRGYLRFSVQIRKEAPFQSVLRNKASLYFDLNKYISTPYTTTTIQESVTAVSEAPSKTPDLRIVPNPGSGIFQIQLADGTQALGMMRVFAPDGRFVWQGQACELNLTGQAPGMYYVLLQGRDGRRYGGKLVLMRN